MTLSDYIEEGAKKAGNLTALAKILDMDPTNRTGAKAHRRGLPTDAAIKLADLIKADRITVISANELATEKKEEKRNFWSRLISQPAISAAQNLRFTECRRRFMKNMSPRPLRPPVACPA